MALIKPVITATASAPLATGGAVTVNVRPVITRLIAFVDAAMIDEENNTTTIPVASFADDAGTPAATLPTATDNSYLDTFVNGVLQQTDIATFAPEQLVIATAELAVGTPVMIKGVDFSQTLSELSTQPTISAPDITISM